MRYLCLRMKFIMKIKKNSVFICLKMLFINETLQSMEVLFLNDDDRYMACISDMHSWLRIHDTVVWLIQLYLILLCIGFVILYSLIYLLSPSSRVFIDYLMEKLSLLSYQSSGRYFHFTVWFVKEMIWISVYILLATFCKWFGSINNRSEITFMDFCRWFIEASSYHISIWVFISIYFCRYFIDWLDDIQNAYDVLMILKIPLFIIMRYAEYQPDCQINALKVSLAKEMCVEN